MFEPMDVDSSYNDEGVDDVETDLDTYIQQKNIVSSNTNSFFNPRYENKGGPFTTGINIFSREEQQKMEERAKRFGLKKTSNSTDSEDRAELYSSMGVFDDNENAKYMRLNTLHMRGTNEMSTQDVFDYFKDYAPASIEWINDVSCNVVWLDKISAARALIGLSKQIVGSAEKSDTTKHKEESVNIEDDFNEGECTDDDDDDDSNTINLKAIDFPLPPGTWRKGVNYPKSNKIILRFSTSSDKKQPNAEKLSGYYKKYGNPNFGGMKGILTDSRKRMYRDIKTKRKSSSKTDDNGTINAKNPWGSLSKSWGVNDSVEEDITQSTLRNHRIIAPGGVKERLGAKLQNKPIIIDDDEEESESESDSDDEWNKRSKVLRMRMHADDEEEKVQKKKLRQIAQKMQERMGGGDLRSRLGRANPIIYREPIKVTVTNIPERLREPQRIHDEEDEGQIVHVTHEVIHDDEDDDDDDDDDEEQEERQWEEEEEEEVEEVKESSEQEEENDESESNSDISEKEVQGPKGSVIKVVPRAKPRVASTVWARLNHNTENTSNQKRKEIKSIVSRDLRSRLGYHKRERSPLRIEVKNDKYTKRISESE